MNTNIHALHVLYGNIELTAICAWLPNPRDMRRVGSKNKTINTSKSFPLLKVGINKVFKMVGCCYNIFCVSIRNKPLDLVFWNVVVFFALTKILYDCNSYIIDLVVESYLIYPKIKIIVSITLRVQVF